MGDAYPELRRDKARVAQVLKAEEERFGETLDNGMRILERGAGETRSPGSGAEAERSRRRDRVRALRHVRLPARSHRGRRARPRRRGRRSRIRSRDGRAARARARCVAVQDGRLARLRRPEDAVPRLRNAVRGRSCGCAVSRRRERRIARDRAARHRRARFHAVLCRGGRPGRRPWRAHQGRRVPDAVQRRGHAEGAAGRLRPRGRGRRPASCASATRSRHRSTSTRAAARFATTRRRT